MASKQQYNMLIAFVLIIVSTTCLHQRPKTHQQIYMNHFQINETNETNATNTVTK
jgi:hypothetical protein